MKNPNGFGCGMRCAEASDGFFDIITPPLFNYRLKCDKRFFHTRIGRANFARTRANGIASLAERTNYIERTGREATSYGLILERIATLADDLDRFRYLDTALPQMILNEYEK